LSIKTPFKDIRKISIGLCCKDITSYRRKKRKAFYNCFVVLLRILYRGAYKEMHVKVFNTGKLEITGIQTDELLESVHTLLLNILRPIVESDVPLELLDRASDTVLINSHFKCGYYVNRERFHHILKYNYNINSNYDPCSYPGIQCEFYYDTRLAVQHGMQPASFSSSRKELEIEKEAAKDYVQKVSFMVFRTGSVLIVGKCSDAILQNIYTFLCAIFVKEYKEICGTMPPTTKEVLKKNRKIRKKTIYV
jgi:TATA-box binding protein (TBP) (component of TFIID and TFIIIB)